MLTSAWKGTIDDESLDWQIIELVQIAGTEQSGVEMSS